MPAIRGPRKEVMKSLDRFKYSTIVMGASTGGLKALKTILAVLPADFALAVVLVVHRHPDSNSYMEKYLNSKCRIDVKPAEEKEKIQGGAVYIAPANYHLLIEDDRTFSLSVGDPVNYARPSIDVLFESAAHVYGPELIGIILTGNNNDGSQGLKKIKIKAGLTIVQAPETADAGAMPRVAISAVEPDPVLPIEEIGLFFNRLNHNNSQSDELIIAEKHFVKRLL